MIAGGAESTYDYAQGTVDVEIALPADKTLPKAVIQQQLKDTVLKTLSQGADNRSLLEIAHQPVAISKGPPVLQGLCGMPGQACSSVLSKE